jgi:DNA-binding NarL/FixJ family response regulator
MTEPSPIKVFIAEDQEIARIGLVTLLSRMPAVEVVGSANNGQDAHRQCLSIKPNVVIMDLSMPVMNGVDATELIRKDLPETRVVIMTTHDRDEDVFGALGAGADGYCLKTATGEQLLAAIKTVADGGAWLDPAIANRVLRASTTASSPSAKKDGSANDMAKLTERELEVLKLLVDGLNNQEMASHLFLSLETIKSHMRHIMEKLAVSDRTQAAVRAVRQGLV